MSAGVYHCEKGDMDQHPYHLLLSLPLHFSTVYNGLSQDSRKCLFFATAAHRVSMLSSRNRDSIAFTAFVTTRVLVGWQSII